MPFEIPIYKPIPGAKETKFETNCSTINLID